MFRMIHALLVASLCFHVCGCVVPPPPDAQPAVDPFQIQPNPNLPGGFDPNCPGGQCPIQTGGDSSTGIEVGLTEPVDVDAIAANEVKRSEAENCLPCLRRPFARPAQQPTAQPQGPQLTPTSTRVQAKSSAADEIKHGAFRCEICGNAVVGDEWEDLWSEDGMSLHCICRNCFAKSTASQREAALKRFVSRSDPDLMQLPTIQHAIKEASSR
jgi:hypothetical protein